jgi:hypothetical protein
MNAADKTAGLRAARACWPRWNRSMPPASRSPQPAVPSTAGVSTWLVYADGLRPHLDAARRRQADRPRSTTDEPPAVTTESLPTDLVIARTEIRRLRADNDKLRGRLRLQLGAEIEVARTGTAYRACRHPR